MSTQAPGGDGLSGSRRFTGAALERTHAEGLTSAEGLVVVVDGVGITTEGPRPGIVRTVEWHQLSTAHVGEPARFPDGSPAVTIVATAGEDQMRWFIPAVQLPPVVAAALEEELSRLVGTAPPAREPAPAPRQPAHAAREPEPPSDDDPWGLTARATAPLEPAAAAATPASPATPPPPEPVALTEPEPIATTEPQPEPKPEPEPVVAASHEPVLDAETESQTAADSDRLLRPPTPSGLGPLAPFVPPGLDGGGGPGSPISPPLVVKRPYSDFVAEDLSKHPSKSGKGEKSSDSETDPPAPDPEPAEATEESSSSLSDLSDAIFTSAPLPASDADAATPAPAAAQAKATDAPAPAVAEPKALPKPTPGNLPVPLTPRSAPRRAAVRRSKRRRITGMVMVALLVVGGVIVGLAVSRAPTPPPPAPIASTTTTPDTADVQTAAAVSLTSNDVPTSWKADPHPAVSAVLTAEWRLALSSCLGLSAAEDPLGNPSVLTASNLSPVLAGSTAPDVVEIGSEAVVYPSSATVSAEISELSRPTFAACLEQAEEQTVNGASATGASVSPLTLEQVPGVRSIGYQVRLPGTGSAPVTYVDFMVVAGGRVTTRLMGIGVGQEFPPLVAAASSYSIAKLIAAQESGT